MRRGISCGKRRAEVASHSPYDLQTLVELEGFVRRDDRNVFHEGLGDDLTVERIRMMCGQIEETERMLRPIRHDPQSQISDACDRVCLAQRQLPPGLFNGNLGQETTLISRTALDFRTADMAARERRSGVLTAQMKVTVSRMSRMRQRPSRRASTSSSVIGFHQSES
jgi:hypothetical protein